MAWQLIETAPKDGTTVLLYIAHLSHEIPIAGYFHGRDYYEREYDDPEYMEAGWYVSYGYDDWHGAHDVTFEPTHWMPLPPQPAE